MAKAAFSHIRQLIYLRRMKAYWGIVVCLFVMISCAPPRALEYQTYHNLSIQSLGFSQSMIALELEYYNPNNFGLQLRNTDLDIFIDGTLLGHSSSDTLIKIPRKGNFVLPVKFNVDMRNAFKNAFNALRGKEILIQLEGKIKVGKGNTFINFPVKYETRQTFSLF